jgi:hypothetical protein
MGTAAQDSYRDFMRKVAQGETWVLVAAKIFQEFMCRCEQRMLWAQ